MHLINATLPLFTMLALITGLHLPSIAKGVICAGDCNGSGEVTVDEINLTVNIALGGEPAQACDSADSNRDGVVHVHELLLTVSNALEGCPINQVIRSTLERDVATVDSATTAELVRGNSAFALDLYQQLRQGKGNLFFSPLSVSIAFALLHPGSKTNTASQIAEAMHYTLPEESLHQSFNWLDGELASRGKESAGTDGGKFRLNITNALWGQRDFSFLDSYLDLLGRHYGAGMHTIDFSRNPERARQQINSWVSEQTEGRIPDLMSPGTITGLTRLVLTNAVYFNAAWEHQFSPELTEDGEFLTLSNDIITVDMMKQASFFRRTQGEEFSAIELPYDSEELSMLIIVPENFTRFEAQFSTEGLQKVLDNLRQGHTQLRLPRFEYSSKFKLNDTLQELGMTDAFSSTKADLAGIDGSRRLFVQSVVHQGFVNVNEAGTEAAAATGIGIGVTSVPRPFTVDRPFLFLIRDHATESIVFMGRVVDP